MQHSVSSVDPQCFDISIVLTLVSCYIRIYEPICNSRRPQYTAVPIAAAFRREYTVQHYAPRAPAAPVDTPRQVRLLYTYIHYDTN